MLIRQQNKLSLPPLSHFPLPDPLLVLTCCFCHKHIQPCQQIEPNEVGQNWQNVQHATEIFVFPVGAEGRGKG